VRDRKQPAALACERLAVRAEEVDCRESRREQPVAQLRRPEKSDEDRVTARLTSADDDVLAEDPAADRVELPELE